MSDEYRRPLPHVSEVSRPYWEATRRHELVLQRCRDCGRHRYPPGEICPRCLSDKLTWERVSGRGTVYSWIVFHQVYQPAFAGNVPYAVAVVELEEGARLTTNIVGCKIEDIEIGMPVKVVFEDVAGEITLPKFRPAVSPASNSGQRR